VPPPSGESRASSEPDQDLHIPLTSRAVFWQPRHLALSNALLHVPFLFWLVETCRPANIVQIGTGDGVGFMALCQAVDKLSLETPCIGLSPDPAAPALPAPLAEQHRTHYDDFSFVIQDDPVNAIRHVHQSRIDFLVLNTELTDELVMALRAHWQTRLSDRAVVVVCNPARLAQRQPAQEFLNSLGAACPGVRLQHADTDDIETYLVGKDQPERLKKLAALDLGAPGYLAARQVFARLGQGLHQGQLARASDAARREAEAELVKAGQNRDERESELLALRDEIEHARGAEAEQAALAADLQARLFDAERVLVEEQQNSVASEAMEKLRSELNASEAQITDLEQAHAERLADIEALSEGFEKRLEEAGRQRKELETTVQTLQTSIAAQQESLNERLADIAALTKDYESRLAELRQRLSQSDEKRIEFLEAKRSLQGQLVERDLALAAMARKLEDVTLERDGLQQSSARALGELEQLTRKLEEIDGHRNALLNSTSWRMTSPIRKVKQVLRREA